ncbi:MAG: hypothetical protein ACK4K0_04670 [Flavobacteriales bacterium]
MRIEKFYSLLSNPALMTHENEVELESVIVDFPYFNLPHILLAFQKKALKESSYQEYLARSAVYTGDRKKLYEYLIQSDLKEKIELAIEQLTNEHIASEEDTKISNNSLIGIEKSNKKEDADLTKLEEDILAEAINNSIQLELQAYKLEEAIETKRSAELIEQERTERKIPRIDEPRSFNEWLNLSRIEKIETPVKKSRREEIASLVDQFIANEPKISQKKTEFFSPGNIARMSLVENDDFVTETLAKIYHQQKNFEKAIKAYQQLILKIPEKKSFFAAQIEILNQEIKQTKK